MTELFDRYRLSYNDVVASSVSFSGLRHTFFLEAKIPVLRRALARATSFDKGDVPRVLDIGCGVGSMHSMVAPLFSNLDACDISAESVARAREEHPNVRYKSYTPPRLPYPDHTFDLAYAVCVLHHVPYEERSAFAAEMKRVIKPGGVACLIEHNPLNPLTRLAVMRCPFDEDAVLLSHWAAGRLLDRTGLRKARSEHFLLLPTMNVFALAVERSIRQLPLGAQYACSALL